MNSPFRDLLQGEDTDVLRRIVDRQRVTAEELRRGDEIIYTMQAIRPPSPSGWRDAQELLRSDAQVLLAESQGMASP